MVISWQLLPWTRLQEMPGCFFALTGDVTRAHRLVKAAEQDWGLLACLMAEQGRLVWHLQLCLPLVVADERPGEGSLLHRKSELYLLPSMIFCGWFVKQKDEYFSWKFWFAFCVEKVRGWLFFFPSNAFMASARSFNTFNCMLQIGLQELITAYTWPFAN